MFTYCLTVRRLRDLYYKSVPMTTVSGNITYRAEIFNGGSFLVYFVGYVYQLLDCEKAVRSLLQECTHDNSSGEYIILVR